MRCRSGEEKISSFPSGYKIQSVFLSVVSVCVYQPYLSLSLSLFEKFHSTIYICQWKIVYIHVSTICCQTQKSFCIYDRFDDRHKNKPETRVAMTRICSLLSVCNLYMYYIVKNCKIKSIGTQFKYRTFSNFINNFLHIDGTYISFIYIYKTP